MKTFPVVHYLTDKHSFEQASLVLETGADGLFLISHSKKDDKLAPLAVELKSRYPAKLIGLNYLWEGPVCALRDTLEHGLDMAWGDYCGISSDIAESPLSLQLQQSLVKSAHVKLFCSVAFKYQSHEPNPALAALNALKAGFIPTTSGSATGSAPDLPKIQAMAKAVNNNLAVASGMTAQNIKEFRPYLEYCLVATGVSKDEHTFDVSKLREFIQT